MESSTNSKNTNVCKTADYEKSTIWLKFSKLAMETQSVNLGQGFPDWKPPQFLLDSLVKNIQNPSSNHQYTRAAGALRLVEALAKTYSPRFKREIDPMKEILVSNGAVSLLYNIITAYIHPGDEMIAIEGFYDCYLPQAEFCGGKIIGVPLIPPKNRDRSEYLDLVEKGNKDGRIKDNWQFDFEKLEQSFTDKTKILILNTPHNPTGKVISFEEMYKIKAILDKHPGVILIMDEVYEYMVYDEYEEMPRFATLDGMWDRTVSIMSAGKIFSATGLRIGWAIGNKDIIKKATAIFQYNSFCLYDPVMQAVADALEEANNPYEGYESYYKWLRGMYMEKRNYFVQSLAKNEKFDLPFWLPEGGYFVICDISKKPNEEKYQFEGEIGVKNSKDFNYILNMANEKKVVGIPCSPFYTRQNLNLGENFIRLAFCKIKETMDKALDNFSKY